jgi:hypothetical protein
VERPAGHLDQRALFWDEAKSSAHAQIRRKKWPPLTNLHRSAAYKANLEAFDNFRDLRIPANQRIRWHFAPVARSPGRRSPLAAVRRVASLGRRTTFLFAKY